MSDHDESAQVILAVERLGFPWKTQDPFLFCVYHHDRYPAGNAEQGPAASLAGRRLGMDFTLQDGWRMYHGRTVPGFPEHPHRGFETVTVVRQGLVDHSDSLGAAGRYGPGDTQWMTAGAGIQHAEMFPLVHPGAPNPLELFQIWLNLPARSKMVAPHFKMLWAEQTPEHAVTDSAGRVTRLCLVAGSHEAIVPPSPPPDSWAAQPQADVAIWTLTLEPQATWRLPAAQAGTNRTLYFYSGSELHVAGRLIPAERLVELRADVPVSLACGAEPAKLLLLQGRPLGEPVVQHGPFVMNTRAEIQQAMADYQRTRFGGWPWPRPDPVHPQEEGRFARHEDGRLERPAASTDP